jgi:CHAT domain-containing protein
MMAEMKFKFIFFILFFGVLNAQTYEKDWNALYKKLDSGEDVSAKEMEGFIAKHKKVLSNYPDNSTQLYSALANTYYHVSDFKKSEESYLESYQYAQNAGDTSLKHIVELSLAIFNYNANRLLEAEKYYRSCMAGMAAVYGQSSREYTQIFFDYTRLLIDLGRYTDADPYVDALLYYYKTLDGEKSIRYISLLNSKAIIFQNTGRYAEAIEIYSNVVEAGYLKELGDTLGYVISILNFGDIYREIGNYEPAITNLKKAKAEYSQLGMRDKETLATIENNLALCYKSTDELKLSEDAFNHSLSLRQESGGANSEPYCSTLSNKADLLRVLGRYGEASDLLLTALQIRRENFGDKTENYANALSNLANVYYSAGYYEEALEKNVEAKAIYLEVLGENNQAYGNCLNSLSLCYLYFKNYQKAEECKLQSLKIIEATIGKNNYRYPAYLISTYGLYRKTNQLDKAEKNIKEALVLVERNFGKKHDLYASAELALAEIYAINQKYEAAGPLYFDCLNYYSDQMGDYFNAMSESDQMSFLNLINAAFESYNIYVINYKLNFMGKDLSQHIRLTLKYQLLLKSLLANKSAIVRKEIANSKDEELKNIYKEWLSLKNEMINNYKSADAASEDNNGLYKRTSELEMQLKTKVKSFIEEKEVSFEQLKNNLQPNEAAIEIFKVWESLNDSQSVVRYGALVIKKNSKEPELIIFKYGNKMDEGGFSQYSNCIEELIKDTLSYGLYFKPFETTLQGINRLYVSSDGVFHKISWQSLYNPQRKKYLVDELEVFQTSNLGSFAKSNTKLATTGLNASLFGYPDYDYDFKLNQAKENLKANQLVAKRFGLANLPKLPGTKTEVEEIEKELETKNWTVNSYMNELASEENLRKINSPRVLHIATHGFYLKDIESEDKLFLGFENSMIKNNSLLRSGVILAGAGPATEDSTYRNSENDGILTAYEACLLNLSNTELVVLSACQTGLGDDMGTEGVAGLQRSLAIAGAKNIMMSLWPVDDFATQYLMTEFYKNYASTQNVETSFRIAQAAVKGKFPQPIYWAAFVLLKTFN